MDEAFITHAHTGLDSPKINPLHLKGFPIYSTVPTHNALAGTIVLYSNGTDEFRIYVRINNTWKYAALT